MHRLPGPAEWPTEQRSSRLPRPLRIVSGLAVNTNSIFCDGSLEPKAANGCPVLRTAGTTSREADVRTAKPDIALCAFSRTRPGTTPGCSGGSSITARRLRAFGRYA